MEGKGSSVGGPSGNQQKPWNPAKIIITPEELEEITGTTSERRSDPLPEESKNIIKDFFKKKDHIDKKILLIDLMHLFTKIHKHKYFINDINSHNIGYDYNTQHVIILDYDINTITEHLIITKSFVPIFMINNNEHKYINKLYLLNHDDNINKYWSLGMADIVYHLYYIHYLIYLLTSFIILINKLYYSFYISIFYLLYHLVYHFVYI